MTTFKSKIVFEGERNYMAFFLTLACNLKCSYCINHAGGSLHQGQSHLSAKDWIKAINRLEIRNATPVTLQGGEPTLHKDFYEIVNEAEKDIKMDLLTNLMFDVDKFIKNVPIWRFQREAKYAPIRVSYHPGQNDINDLIKKTHTLEDAGFRIGIYGIAHPDKRIFAEIEKGKDKCIANGIDFRLKEYLGFYDGVLYGKYKYDGACDEKKFKKCFCKTSELLVDPAGYIFRCHADLYKNRNAIAHILDDDFTIEKLDDYIPCENYGDCNPCDIKIKTNRFQQFGHTSVDIKNITG